MVKSLVINSLLLLSTPIYEIKIDDNFASMLDNKIQVSDIQSDNMKSKQGKAVDALALAKQWMISPDCSKNTVRKTIQCDTKTVMNLQMSWWYPTNGQILRCPCITHRLFTETVISGTVSKRGKRMLKSMEHRLAGRFCSKKTEEQL